MTLTAEKIVCFARGVLGDDPKVPKLPMEKYLEAIPRLKSLADVPSGTPVLIRGDVDAKPGPKVGDGDIRLRSMKDTLDFGRQRGWKQIIFGHIGREPEKSLAKVAARLGEILGCEVTFHRRLARSGHHDHQGRRGQDDRRPPRRAASSCWKTRGSTTSSACSGRPSRPICPSWPTSWPSWPTSSPRRSPRSTSTRRFPPAASTPRASSCRRRWSASPWASTRPSSSTCSFATASPPNW